MGDITALIASITTRLRRLSVEELRVLDEIALALESNGLRDDAHARRLLVETARVFAEEAP